MERLAGGAVLRGTRLAVRVVSREPASLNDRQTSRAEPLDDVSKGYVEAEGNDR